MRSLSSLSLPAPRDDKGSTGAGIGITVCASVVGLAMSFSSGESTGAQLAHTRRLALPARRQRPIFKRIMVLLIVFPVGRVARRLPRGGERSAARREPTASEQSGDAIPLPI